MDSIIIILSWNKIILLTLARFFAGNWQSLAIGVTASVLATALVAFWLVYFYRTPKLKLNLNFQPGHMTARGYSSPILDFNVENKKNRVGFGNGDVSYGIFMPVSFVKDKDFIMVTLEGEKGWGHDLRGKKKFSIEGEEYYLFRAAIHLAVHPTSRIHFLRMGGSYENDTSAKFYYYFETPFGRVPSGLKLDSRVEAAENGKLPSEEIEFN